MACGWDATLRGLVLYRYEKHSVYRVYYYWMHGERKVITPPHRHHLTSVSPMTDIGYWATITVEPSSP
jgi:NADPH-dependent ferric siderophore reductase